MAGSNPTSSPAGVALIEWASRIGYAARGVTYLAIGAVALLAALHLTPSAHGVSATLKTWSQWPMGPVLVAVIAVSLAGFAVWRFWQAAFDADRHGTSPRAWAVRVGQAVSGLVYGGVALSAFKVLDGFEDPGEGDENHAVRGVAATILAWPHGDVVLTAMGWAILAVGLGYMLQGFGQDFTRRLSCGPRFCRWVLPLAKIGYVARGFAILPLGAVVVRAGLNARAGEARSWGGALQALAHQPFGHFALALIAAGLIAFGLFGLVEAVFRRVDPSGGAQPAAS